MPTFQTREVKLRDRSSDREILKPSCPPIPCLQETDYISTIITWFLRCLLLFFTCNFYCVIYDLSYLYCRKYLLSFVLNIIYHSIILSLKHKIDYPLKIKMLNWREIKYFFRHFKYLMIFSENFLNFYFCASYMVFVDDSRWI